MDSDPEQRMVYLASCPLCGNTFPFDPATVATIDPRAIRIRQTWIDRSTTAATRLQELAANRDIASWADLKALDEDVFRDLVDAMRVLGDPAVTDELVTLAGLPPEPEPIDPLETDLASADTSTFVPICPDCVQRINRMRARMGLPAHTGPAWTPPERTTR